MTNVKYYEGDCIGDFGAIFEKRIDGHNGIFKCGYCGKLFRAAISNIKSGNTKSCGCMTKKIISDKLTKDIAGQRFGNLVACRETEYLVDALSQKERKKLPVFCKKCIFILFLNIV